MQTKIVQTADGSSSVYISRFDELYHSVNGAISESKHVFIETGLKHAKKSDIKVFEMGYGTGLNFILSYLQSKNTKIEYESELDDSLPKNVKQTDFLNTVFKTFNLYIEPSKEYNNTFNIEPRDVYYSQVKKVNEANLELEAMPNIVVQVFDSSNVFVTDSQTNDLGEFLIQGLDAGDYILKIEQEGYVIYTSLTINVSVGTVESAGIIVLEVIE